MNFKVVNIWSEHLYSSAQPEPSETSFSVIYCANKVQEMTRMSEYETKQPIPERKRYLVILSLQFKNKSPLLCL